MRRGDSKTWILKQNSLLLSFLWIKKLKNPTNHHPWQVVACELLSNFGGDKLFHSNSELSDYCKSILKDILPFYQEVIL